jgi:hypothetical protein
MARLAGSALPASVGLDERDPVLAAEWRSCGAGPREYVQENVDDPTVRDLGALGGLLRGPDGATGATGATGALAAGR